MRAPKVWNRRNPNTPNTAVYVGRPTIWGNPFVIGKDGTRAEVIEKYRAYITSEPELVRLACTELKGADLVCWCAPEACHADVLLEIANSGV